MSESQVAAKVLEAIPQAAKAEVPQMLEALTKLTEVFGKFIHQQHRASDLSNVKAAVCRMSQTKFMNEFKGWVDSKLINEIVYVTQSESDGNVTLTLFYR